MCHIFLRAKKAAGIVPRNLIVELGKHTHAKNSFCGVYAENSKIKERKQQNNLSIPAGAY
jgi:hypothetical protein